MRVDSVNIPHTPNQWGVTKRGFREHPGAISCAMPVSVQICVHVHMDVNVGMDEGRFVCVKTVYFVNRMKII